MLKKILYREQTLEKYDFASGKICIFEQVTRFFRKFRKFLSISDFHLLPTRF